MTFIFFNNCLIFHVWFWTWILILTKKDKFMYWGNFWPNVMPIILHFIVNLTRDTRVIMWVHYAHIRIAVQNNALISISFTLKQVTRFCQPWYNADSDSANVLRQMVCHSTPIIRVWELIYPNILLRSRYGHYPIMLVTHKSYLENQIYVLDESKLLSLLKLIQDHFIHNLFLINGPLF